MVDRRMAYEAYRKRTEIPRGLDYLAERLVRAVIRVQPKNVHEFAAQFFDGLLQQRDLSSKSRSPSPDNAFETPQFETVPVTQQPKRSYNTSATGISVADNRVHSYEEYDEYDTDDEMAINCDDFEKYTLDIDDDMHSVHYVESTALTRLAASSSSVAILGTTAKCRSAGTSSAIQGQQSSSPSPSVSSLPTKPRPPLIGSVSQPTLDSGYNNQTAAREIAAKTEKTVVASSNSKETQEQWLSEDQWTEHLAKKSGHRAARFLDEDTGPPPPSPSPFSKPSVQWPLKWPIVDSSTQRNLNHMPVGVIEVIDREPVDQRPPPLTKAQRFPGTQRVSRNQNIHLPVIHAMEMKSNSLGHEDLFKTMRVQPPSSDRHGFRSRTGTGSSTFDSSSRKPFNRQSNEMKSQFTDDEYYAATGWMSNMPVFAKCPPPKAKSLSSGESKLSHTTAEVGMADKQPSVQPVSALPYDKSDIDNSTKCTIRKDDEVSTIVPIALKCATTVSDAIDKPDSFKKPSDQNVEDDKLDVAATTQENNPVDEPNEEVQPELKAEKELENIKVKNENDVEKVLKDQKNAANNNNSNNSKDEEPKLETEYRLTMIHSVREAVNRICEQAVEKTAAIVRGIHKRSSNVTLTSSFKDRDLSEFTDNVSSAFSLPPLPQQYPLDSGLTGQESSWPPPPEELEEEKTIAPGFSFDLPDPPTGMDQMDSETDKLDISDEEMKSIGLPNDETDTESGDGGAENDRSGSEIDLVMKSAANGGSSDGSVQAAMAVVQDNGADDRAATTIQAVYRGFRARKYVEAVNAAAVKIQAGFRGYRVRQSLKNTAPSTATTTTDDSECWSDDDQKSIVSVTYAPLKEYGCEPRGAGDGRDDDDSEDDGDEPSSSGSKGDSISVVSGDVGIGGGDGEGNGEGNGDGGCEGDGSSSISNIGGAHVGVGVELSGIGAYEYDEDDEDQLQTGDDEVFEPDDKDTGGGGSVGNLVTNPTTTLTESETPTEMSKLDDVAEAEELVQAAIKIQARVRGFAARKRLNDKKNEVADEKK